MNILYIPVDSRPCNLRFPLQIAEMAGQKLIVPAEMDYFTTPADFEAQRVFLEENIASADHLVISIDHWCYGSLLESRLENIPVETVMERLDILSELISRRPGLRVWAFNVIMRSSISALKNEDLPYYNLMTEFSQQWYRAQMDDAEKDKLEAIRAQIPQRILDRYFFVRRRNHAVNMRAAQMAMDGQFHKLLLLMEDSQAIGFHTFEQQEIRRLVGDTPHIFIHNGTDEGGMILVAAALTEGTPRVKMRTVYLQGDRETFWAMLEDRPFYQNIASQCEAVGIDEVEEGEDCVLCVVLPVDNEQKDREQSKPVTDACVNGIIAEIAKGKPVALLDEQTMNCGDMELIDRLGKENLHKLSAYAAWNTAGNCLGTILSQLRVCPDGRCEAARAFLWERLLDDGLYQGEVRQRLVKALQARGEDVFHLTDKPAANALLAEMFAEAMQAHAVAGFDALSCRAVLPWDRTFEADVRLEKE